MLAALMTDKVKLCHHLTKESRMSQHVLTGDKTASFPGTQKHLWQLSSAHSWNQDNKVTFLLLDGTSHSQSRPPDLNVGITYGTLKEETIKMSNSILR